jgi:predicted small lipoprotein YifL
MRSIDHAVASLGAALARSRTVALGGALAVALAATLAGCGQKGPLVLPDTDTTGVVIRPSPTPAATSPAAPAAPASSADAPATTPSAAAPVTAAPASGAAAAGTTPPSNEDPPAPRRDSAPRH